MLDEIIKVPKFVLINITSKLTFAMKPNKKPIFVFSFVYRNICLFLLFFFNFQVSIDRFYYLLQWLKFNLIHIHK